MSKFKLIALIAVTGLLISAYSGCAARKEAAQYPTKPITCIFPTEAGSMLDTLSRPLLQIAEKKLGQPIMVVNKPGGGLIAGLRDVVDAKPDGYTIGFGVGNLSYAKLLGLVPFDHRDFDVLAIPYYAVPVVTVPANSKFNSVAEIVEYAKANPKQLRVVTSTKGGAWWVATRMLARAAGIEVNEISPPGGGGAVVLQVAGGHADVGVHGIPEAKSQIDAGNIRVLATFGTERIPGFENVPTLKELGYNVEFLATNTAVAPKGLPKDVKQKLLSALEDSIKDPQYQEFVKKNSAVVLGKLGDDAARYLDQQLGEIEPILQEAGLIKK
jgi:tripartite-type tricarboxylate transporter receptor subunit TctC